MGQSACLTLLLAAVVVGCGSTNEAGDENKAPAYAATPRKALESWVVAVREGDIEMMCRLLNPKSGCATADKKAFVKAKLLPHVRAEMRGLRGDLRYGAISIGEHAVIGVVSGESAAAYAVPVTRGTTQWSIGEETDGRALPGVRLIRPDPAAPLPAGRTNISFSAWAWTPGSVYPDGALWIDSRHVEGRLGDIGEEENFSGLTRIWWEATPRLRAGRHVMVAGVRSPGGIAASAWVLTVR